MDIMRGLRNLFSPRTSEFWSAVLMVVCQGAVLLGWVTQEQVNGWLMILGTYTSLRFTSKMAGPSPN